MYAELYRYFIQHKKLYLPGIGNFILERKPAEADFVNRCINPPSYSISLQQESVKPSSKFFAWLASVFNISEKEAIIRFNDFVFDLKKEINSGSKVEWNGIGIISKGLGDTIRFSAEELNSTAKVVHAEKVIREKAEHAILVGERERTSVEMTELLSIPAGKKSIWWVIPLFLALLAFMFIGWYLSKNGLSTASVSNTKKNIPAVSSETYKQIK
jgi:hypothetical protein